MHTSALRLQPLRSRWWLRAASVATVLLLAACGFAMRGVTPLPFSTLYVGVQENSRFGADLRRSLRAASPNTRLVNQPSEADAILQVVSNNRTLREVSLSAQGRVEEYELGINFTFRLINNKGLAILPDTTLSVYRDMPYDDQVVQAKDAQMETLYEFMQQSLVERLLRRLTAPDVQTAYAEAQRSDGDLGTPVYDPSIVPSDDTPATWRTPKSPGIGPR